MHLLARTAAALASRRVQLILGAVLVALAWYRLRLRAGRRVEDARAPASAAVPGPSRDRRRRRAQTSENGTAWQARGWHYARLRELLRNVPLPAVVVDLEIFDANVSHFADIARRYHKTIRLATKSIRVPHLIGAL